MTYCVFLSGLPKPAVITQVKTIGMSKFFQLFFFNASDIVYTVTPLYHSAAGGIGLMAVLDVGMIHLEDLKQYCTNILYFDNVIIVLHWSVTSSLTFI